MYKTKNKKSNKNRKMFVTYLEPNGNKITLSFRNNKAKDEFEQLNKLSKLVNVQFNSPMSQKSAINCSVSAVKSAITYTF